MGYDVERFVGYVNEGLLCCVCRDVLEDPLQAPCEHAFCNTCIQAWLVNHQNCPEDRLPLNIANLRPLYRYMRNDLARLQVKCTYRSQGCDVICALESIQRHEEQCDFALLNYSNAGDEYLCYRCGCPVQVSQRSLEAHVCVYRDRVCPRGCGYTLSNADKAQHNCISELRAEVDLLRTELDCKVEKVRREMESRLDSQRRHMVQKESSLKNEVDELKGHLSRVVSDVCTLLGAERTRRKELERAELEKAELLERLKNEVLTPGTATQTGTRGDEEHRKPNPHSLTLDCLRKKSRDVTVL